MSEVPTNLVSSLFHDAYEEFEMDQAEIHELNPERDLMFPEEGLDDDDDC